MARIIDQNPDLKQEFQRRINEKIRLEKERTLGTKPAEDAGLFGWVTRTWADIKFEAEQHRKEEKGSWGELQVSQLLKRSLPDSWVLMNDVIVEPGPDKFAQNDHILIGPAGVFVIETKAWDGSFTAYKDHWKRRVGKDWVMCDSPTRQNARHAKLIGSWLLGTGLVKIVRPQEQWITPLVVFTQAKWLGVKECSHLVFQGANGLVKHLQSQTQSILSPAEIEKITSLFRYPKVNMAFRNGLIQVIDFDDYYAKSQAEPTATVETPAEDKKDLPHHDQGTTKDGKSYIRVQGEVEAKQVYEHYMRSSPHIGPLKKDRFKEGVFYFYLG